MNKKVFFNVFGKKVQIIRDDLALSKQDLHGLYIPSQYKIFYNGSEKEEAIKTLIHELVHAVCHITGLKQTSLSDDIEEIIAENISQAIVENLVIKMKR